MAGRGAIEGLQTNPYNPYAGGSDYYLNPPYGINQWTANSGTDWLFQTYVSPVPLPPAALLLLSGLALFGALARLKFARPLPSQVP